MRYVRVGANADAVLMVRVSRAALVPNMVERFILYFNALRF